MDKEEVKRNNPIIDVIGRYTELRGTGNGEYEGKCPFHDDNNPSFSVNAGKGVFFCHGCLEAGDVIRFVQRIEGVDFKTAVSSLGNGSFQPNSLNPNHTPTKASPKPSKKKGSRKPQKDLPPPVASYIYTNELGERLYRVQRFEPPGEEKTFRQQRPGNEGMNEPEWIPGIKGVSRVPYRLHELVNSDKEVIIVEGEKDVDNLVAIGFTATTNSGGAGNWQKNFNRYFRDMDVVIIPDNDTRGQSHGRKVHEELKGYAKTLRLITLPDNVKDVSEWIEAGGTADQLRTLIGETPAEKGWKLQQQERREESIEKVTSGEGPFQALGSDDTKYYFLSENKIKHIPYGSITSPSYLLGIANKDYWKSIFGTTASGNCKWEDVGDYCVELSRFAGLFNPEIVRGRGAWMDDGRTLLHLGDRLVVDGKNAELSSIKSRYIYPSALPIEGTRITEQSTPKQGKDLFELLRLLPLTYDREVFFLLGFCFLASICGALQWRPHLWLTGSKGTGKSWILDNVIMDLLGNVSLRVNSNTTEAGVRQMLKHDAFPVIFDEAEGESKEGSEKLQKVIDLARQASSESSASIVKGTPSGDALFFKVRSMFMFSSINVGVIRDSDDSRVNMVFLDPAKKTNERYEALKEKRKEILTTDFCDSFRSRAYTSLPAILKNIETFSNELRNSGNDSRYSDQMGTLIGGAWSAMNDGEVDSLTAKGFLVGIKLDEEKKNDADVLPDHEQLHNWLRQAQIRVIPVTGSTLMMSVSELYLFVRNKMGPTNNVGPREAEDALKRHGFRVEGTNLVVSNTHPAIRQILRDTPWVTRHNIVLKRIDGATSINQMRFLGVKTGAVKVPQDE